MIEQEHVNSLVKPVRVPWNKEKLAVAVSINDVAPSGYTMDRATIRQKKTRRAIRFELTDQPRQAIDEYLHLTGRQTASSSSRVVAIEVG